ncbi:MAG: aminomethyl transferase family protein [Acidobacteria bacterium]|nr:aminomethyl transferase family protein [Acidobacteriota bacterium]
MNEPVERKSVPAAAVERDYEALRTGAALVDPGPVALFEMNGPDATSFLQGMVTNEVKRLAPAEGCFAALLTPGGKMVADLVMLKRSEESFWVVCPGPLKEKTMSALQRFIITDQVELKDMPEQAALAVIGPLASGHLKHGWEVLPEKPFQHLELLVADFAVVLVRDTRFGVDGFQIWMPRDRREECAVWLQRQCGCAPASGEALEVLRIEAGVPAYGVDYDESNLPLESNLDQALNFTKGCYTGQEVVARVTYLGTVSKKLMGLVVEGDIVPAPGEEVWCDNEPAGRVTSAARSPRLGRPVALAYLQRKFLAAAEVRLKPSGARAAVRPLPLVRAEPQNPQT